MGGSSWRHPSYRTIVLSVLQSMFVPRKENLFSFFEQSWGVRPELPIQGYWVFRDKKERKAHMFSQGLFRYGWNWQSNYPFTGKAHTFGIQSLII